MTFIPGLKFWKEKTSKAQKHHDGTPKHERGSGQKFMSKSVKIAWDQYSEQSEENESLVIRFKGINVTLHHWEDASHYETFGKKVLGLLCSPCTKLYRKKTKSTKTTVLKDVDGYIMPGSMTLLLGPSGMMLTGSGKSTLLKVLAGRLRLNKHVKMDGVVLYNNKPNVVPKSSIAYITAQQNVHLPVLTVRETLEFAQNCTRGMRLEMISSAPEILRKSNPYLEFILESYGLKSIENKLVGTVENGINDGERRRLATAETTMGIHSVMMYDMPGSTQDSVITYDLIQTLSTMVKVQQSAAVLPLVQVPPEVFYLFDRIVLLSKGQVIYQGPRQDVEAYFSELGYKKPCHVETVAFLQDIAVGDGGKYRNQNSSAISINEFVTYYKASNHYKDILRVITNTQAMHLSWVETDIKNGLSVKATGTDVLVTELTELSSLGDMSISGGVLLGDKITGIRMPGSGMQYIGDGDGENRENEALKFSELLKTTNGIILIQLERAVRESRIPDAVKIIYAQNWWHSTKCLIRRQLRFTIRNKILLSVRLLQVTILGLFVGSTFYHKGGRIDQFEMTALRTIGFISMMTLMLMNMIQLPGHMLLHRPVFYKQRALYFFRVSSYLVAHAVTSIPQSFIEAFIYSICAYFLTSLSNHTGYYFHYLALIFLVAYMSSCAILLVSALAPRLEVGTSLAGIFIAINLLFSGVPLLPSIVPSYWKWMLYITPVRWGNILFSSTQMKDRYHEPCTSYTRLQFCLIYPQLTVGEAFLRFYELEADRHRIRIAYAAIIIAIIVIHIFSYIAYKKIQFSALTYPGYMKEEKPYVDNVDQEENGLSSRNRLSWEKFNFPVRPVTLSFHNLQLIGKDKRSHQECVLLNNVSAYARAGSMLALLGNTGSGKAYLLNCIAGRYPPLGKFQGDILLNGCHFNKIAFSRVSGFIEKLETHQPFLTVKESLEFSASLRMGQHVSATDKARHVGLVLELMDLSSVKDQLLKSFADLIGPAEEIAVKIAIAVEVASNPSILLLEDPTTQLDTIGTRNVLQLLQTLALTGRTIIITLHHPNTEMLSFCNDALLLRSGQEVYFGPIGLYCSEMLQYFTSIPKVPQYDDGCSPLIFILNILGGGIQKRNAIEDFVSYYKQSSLHDTMWKEFDVICQQDKGDGLEIPSSGYAAAYKMQLKMVFLRNWRHMWRNVKYTFARFISVVALGLVMGTLYLRIDLQDSKSMTSGSLLMYIQAIVIAALTTNNIIPELGTDRLVYYRENRARMYAPVLYPLCWGISELPYLLLGILALVGICNGMAGIAVGSFSIFMKYWICLSLFTMVLTSYGIFLACIIPMPTVGITIGSMTTSIWISSSGVAVPRYNIQFYKWLYWINPLQYTINILTSISFYCDTKTAACLACRVGQACPGCSCYRMLDVEKLLQKIYGPFMSSFLPARFVWDRLSVVRVLEIHRNNTDFLAICFIGLVFAALGFMSFVFLRNNRR